MTKLLNLLIPIILLLGCTTGQRSQNIDALPEKALAQLDSLFSKFNHLDTPGYAIGIIKDTTILFEKGYGAANLEYGLPITPNTVFDIASVSKQFTCGALALLLMEGKLSLEDPVQYYLPQLGKYKDTIRIKHLAYNTSGLTDYFKLPREKAPSWLDFYYFDVDEAIATSLKPDSLAFAPGSEWDYCNTNFILLAKIVEKTSGESFPSFVKTHLFDPLNMEHSLVNNDITTVIPNRATPYNPRNKEYIEAYKQEGISLNPEGAWIQHHRSSPHYGGSGIFASVADLLKWERNFFTHELGGDPRYDQMHRTPKFAHNRDNQAFGLYTDTYQGRSYWAWDGATAGISSQIMRFPEQKVAIVVLSNLGTGQASAKANAIASILIKSGQL